jgi:transcription antitermination factor NusG
VQLDLEVDQWRRINGTRGISTLLTQENKPLAIPAAIIQNLIQQQETQGCVSLDSLALFKIGETVRLLDGAFEDHTATIVSLSDKDRAKILLTFMNRIIEVEMPFTSLERED